MSTADWWTIPPTARQWWAVQATEMEVALESVYPRVIRPGEEAPSMRAARAVVIVHRQAPSPHCCYLRCLEGSKGDFIDGGVWETRFCTAKQSMYLCVCTHLPTSCCRCGRKTGGWGQPYHEGPTCHSFSGTMRVAGTARILEMMQLLGLFHMVG